MTRQEYDQIVGAFELGMEMDGKREENWEFYKTVTPDDLLTELSFAYLKGTLENFEESPAEEYPAENLRGKQPRPEELN
jgi:hypothetical protein